MFCSSSTVCWRNPSPRTCLSPPAVRPRCSSALRPAEQKDNPLEPSGPFFHQPLFSRPTTISLLMSKFALGTHYRAYLQWCGLLLECWPEVHRFVGACEFLACRRPGLAAVIAAPYACSPAQIQKQRSAERRCTRQGRESQAFEGWETIRLDRQRTVRVS